MLGAPIDQPTRDRIFALAKGGSGVRPIAGILAAEAKAGRGVQAVSVASVGRLLQEAREASDRGRAPAARAARPGVAKVRPAAPTPRKASEAPAGPAALPGPGASPPAVEAASVGAGNRRPAPGSSSGGSDLGAWAALRRILGALAPGLVGDVQAGLEAYAGGGLEAWLSSRPAAVPLAAADPEKVQALRKMVASGTFDASAIPRLALGMGVSEVEVRALVASAAGAAGRDAMPLELAAEESIGVMLRVRDKALEANDWKSAKEAQIHVDKVRGLFAKKPAAPRPASRAT